MDKIGELIMLMVGAYAAFRLLRWVWEEHTWVLFVLAALFFGWRLTAGDEKPDKVQEPIQITAPVETVTFVQPTEVSQDKEFRPAYNKGVCQNLKEDICVVTLFITDPDSKWWDNTVKWFLRNKVEPGLRFIEEEAADYGYDIDADYVVHTNVKIDVNVVPFEGKSWSDITQVLEAVAKSLGFSTTQDMLDYHREYTGKEQIVYMVCTNKNGRPYASRTFQSDKNGIEGCFVFYGSANTAASSYNTIFHEVLHLFGAEDYYAEGSERVKREKLAQKLCPNDVMLNSYSAGEKDVGRYTAYCIGWLDEMPQEYNQPDWWS